MTGTRGWPPHRKLSLYEKLEIVKEYERTLERRHIAKLFFCHTGQVNRTLQHKIEIVSEWKRVQHSEKRREKRSACPVLKAVGTILHEFAQRCRYYPIAVNDELLKEKAMEIAQMLNLVSFRGHNYWLKTFKHRFKLADVDWNTWNIAHQDVRNQKSLSLEVIIAELRDELGEKRIPYASKMNENDYEQTIKELLRTGDVYPGYLHGGQQPSCTSYNIPGESIDTIVLDDEDGDHNMSSYDENSNYDIDPMQMLSIETDPKGNDGGENEDPMKIDNYRTALSYFGPLEQFTLTKRSERVITVVNQIGKALLRQAENEVEEDEVRNDDSAPAIINEVQIEGYQDALEYLKPLEEFLLFKECMRIVGLIDQLEILFKEES